MSQPKPKPLPPADVGQSQLQWGFERLLGGGAFGQVWTVTSRMRGAPATSGLYVAKVFTEPHQSSVRAEVEALAYLGATQQADARGGKDLPYWYTHVFMEDFMNTCASYVDTHGKPWPDLQPRLCQYIILDRVNGTNLYSQWPDRSWRLSAPDCARVCVQLWYAIIPLWRINRAHCDLACQNAMADFEHQTVRLVDLGGAQRLNQLRYQGTVYARSRSYYQRFYAEHPETVTPMLRMPNERVAGITGWVTCYTDLEAVVYIGLALLGVRVERMESMKIAGGEAIAIIADAFQEIVRENEASVDLGQAKRFGLAEKVLVAQLLHVWAVLVILDADRVEALALARARERGGSAAQPLLPYMGEDFVRVLCEHVMHEPAKRGYALIAWRGVAAPVAPAHRKHRDIGMDDQVVRGLWTGAPTMQDEFTEEEKLDASELLSAEDLNVLSAMSSGGFGEFFKKIEVPDAEADAVMATEHRVRFAEPACACTCACGGEPANADSAIRVAARSQFKNMVLAKYPWRKLAPTLVCERASELERKYFSEMRARPVEEYVSVARQQEWAKSHV